MTNHTLLTAIALGSAAAGAMAASTTEECAFLVPTEERRRGKGAFFSGCTSRSMTSGRGGCWSSRVAEESGCQTCIVQDLEDTVLPVWATSLFNTHFHDELDACPDLVHDMYAATLEEGIVTSDSMAEAGLACGEWLPYEASCYFKSSYLDVSMDWADAGQRCAEIGGRLVSIETEAENNFVLQNLLWIGFFGEAYTGLQKQSKDGAWSWTDSLAGFSPGAFNVTDSFQDWGEGVDASSSYPGATASCLEISPYSPKAWNPFSCEVNKQYICEKPAIVLTETSSPATPSLSSDEQPLLTPDAGSPLTTPPSTLSPANTPTVAPSSASSAMEDTGPPTGSPSGSPTGFPTGSPTGSPTASPTGSPTGSPTHFPTMYPTEYPTRQPTRSPKLVEAGAACAGELSEADERYLVLYDMGVYVDAACVATPADELAWCNSFNVGQECRSCWKSCQGARSFLEDFLWLPQERVNFCPGADLSTFAQDCEETGEGQSRGLTDTLRSLFRVGRKRRAPPPSHHMLRAKE